MFYVLQRVGEECVLCSMFSSGWVRSVFYVLQQVGEECVLCSPVGR